MTLKQDETAIAETKRPPIDNYSVQQHLARAQKYADDHCITLFQAILNDLRLMNQKTMRVIATSDTLPVPPLVDRQGKLLRNRE